MTESNDGLSDDTQIAANIARLRKDAGMSQAALADAMRSAGQDHWRQNTVSRVERGAQTVGLREVRDLSRILGGNVLAGTDAGESIENLDRTVVEGVTVSELRKLDEALSDQLERVRGLRYILDDKFAADHPEYGREDGD